MLKSRMLTGALVASAAVLALSAVTVRAADDPLAAAKEYIAKVTAPVIEWAGPTTGSAWAFLPYASSRCRRSTW